MRRKQGITIPCDAAGLRQLAADLNECSGADIMRDGDERSFQRHGIRTMTVRVNSVPECCPIGADMCQKQQEEFVAVLDKYDAANLEHMITTSDIRSRYQSTK